MQTAGRQRRVNRQVEYVSVRYFRRYFLKKAFAYWKGPTVAKTENAIKREANAIHHPRYRAHLTVKTIQKALNLKPFDLSYR